MLAISAWIFADRLTLLRDARVRRAVGRREVGHRGLFLCDARSLLGFLRLIGSDLARDRVALRRETRGLLCHLALLGLRLPLALREARQAVLGALDGGFLRADGAVRGKARVLGGIERLFGRMHVEPRGLELGFARPELRPDSRVVLCQLFDEAALELDPADELKVSVGGLVELQVFDLAAVGHVPLRLRGLALERGKAALDFGDDVPHAQQVLLRELHLPFGLLLPALELGDARRLFDEQPPVLRLGAHDEPDLSLLDDRVRLGAGARAEKQVGHVAQADGGLVDEVIALARAIQAPRHGDLGVILVLEGHLLGRVVLEGERDLGEVLRASGLASAEDDVLHGPPAQVPSALLAHAPSNRVDDVRLAAPVGPDDPQNVVIEVENGAVDERLEADELELLDLHPAWTPWRGHETQWTCPTSLHISSPATHHLYPRSLVQFKRNSSNGCPERACGAVLWRRRDGAAGEPRTPPDYGPPCGAGPRAGGFASLQAWQRKGQGGPCRYLSCTTLDTVASRPYSLGVCRPTSTLAERAGMSGNRCSGLSKHRSRCARSARSPRPTA